MRSILGLVAVILGLVAAYYALSPELGALGVISVGAVVQAAYAENMVDGIAGMVGTMVPSNADTRNCETAAGIGFGLACGQGSADKGAVLGGTLANFVGVSVRDVTLVNDVADEYQQNQSMSVHTDGDIWVQTSVAVAVGDPVHYDATTGIFQITGGSGPIVGARYMKAAAAGRPALVRFSGAIPTP